MVGEIERIIMSDAMWGVIIGGLIAALAGLLTAVVASRMETSRWVREKKVEHLRLRISTLTPILENGAAIIGSYEKGERKGLPIQQGAESIVMIASMSTISGELWRDVIKAAKEQQQNRQTVYDAWLNSLAGDIIDARKEIEDLLN